MTVAHRAPAVNVCVEAEVLVEATGVALALDFSLPSHPQPFHPYIYIYILFTHMRISNFSTHANVALLLVACTELHEPERLIS